MNWLTNGSPNDKFLGKFSRDEVVNDLMDSLFAACNNNPVDWETFADRLVTYKCSLKSLMLNSGLPISFLSSDELDRKLIEAEILESNYRCAKACRKRARFSPFEFSEDEIW